VRLPPRRGAERRRHLGRATAWEPHLICQWDRIGVPASTADGFARLQEIVSGDLVEAVVGNLRPHSFGESLELAVDLASVDPDAI
jgi:hypothetical protein